MSVAYHDKVHFIIQHKFGSPLESALSQSGTAADKTVKRLRTDEYRCTKLLSEIKKKRNAAQFLMSLLNDNNKRYK